MSSDKLTPGASKNDQKKIGSLVQAKGGGEEQKGAETK